MNNRFDTLTNIMKNSPLMKDTISLGLYHVCQCLDAIFDQKRKMNLNEAYIFAGIIRANTHIRHDDNLNVIAYKKFMYLVHAEPENYDVAYNV